MTVVFGGDAAALDLTEALRDLGGDPVLVLPEDPVRPPPEDGTVRAKALKTVMMEHRVCGLATHTDAAGPDDHPGPVVLAGRRPTRLWTGEGGLGHGLALGLLAGADATGLAELADDGPRGGLVVDDDGRTGVAGLFAAGGAAGADPPDLDRVARTVAEARTPSRIPSELPPTTDHPMPDGFSEPKLARLRRILDAVSPDADPSALTDARSQARGLLGEMRSYLQARRSEELLDLRDAVVVGLAVVEACRARAVAD